MFPYSYLIWLFLSGKESASFSFFPIVPPFAQVKHIQFNSVYIVMYLCLPFYFHLTFIYINCVFVYLHLILFFCFAQTTNRVQFVTIVCVCVCVWIYQLISNGCIRENICNYFSFTLNLSVSVSVSDSDSDAVMSN